MPNMIKNNFQGFTLIELVIVIGILGALIGGIALIANPLEIFRRRDDVAKANLARSISDAISGYKASQQKMPWVTGADDIDEALNATLVAGTDGDTLEAWMTELVATGALKDGFEKGKESYLKEITASYVIKGSDTFKTLNVCYKPASKDNMAKANKDDDGDTGTTHICY